MTQTNLIIKEVPGLEGRYGATSDGRIFSFRHKRYLKPWLNYYGREMINVCVDYKKRWAFVHRLVYEAWVGPVPDGKELDHINGDKLDNRIENLRPVTRSENMLAYHRVQKLDRNKKRATLSKRVRV